MQAIGYVRVSSIGQATEGVSRDAQRNRIEAWCLANDAELIGLYEDAAMSGGRADNRPGLQAALESACRKDGAKARKGKKAQGDGGKVLVVYSLSRMSRSTKDAIEICERLRKCSCDLVSLSEKIDTTSAAGKMVFRMLAVLAEFERDLASERTKMAAAHKRAKGEAWAVAPFGQTKDEAGRLVADPGEQRAIAEVLRLRGSGATFREIVEAMNGGRWPRRDGGRWHLATVQRVIQRAAPGTGA